MFDIIKGIGTKALIGGAAVFGLYMIMNNTSKSSTNTSGQNKQSSLNGTPKKKTSPKTKSTSKRKCATVKV